MIHVKTSFQKSSIAKLFYTNFIIHEMLNLKTELQIKLSLTFLTFSILTKLLKESFNYLILAKSSKQTPLLKSKNRIISKNDCILWDFWVDILDIRKLFHDLVENLSDPKVRMISIFKTSRSETKKVHHNGNNQTVKF